MLIFSFLFACSQDKPYAGSLKFCLPDALLTDNNSEAPIVLSGDIVDYRYGEGDCQAEFIFQDDENEYVIGYTQFGPEGSDPEIAEDGYVPRWKAAEDVTLSVYTQHSFGTSYGLVVEDDDGILIALEEGYWGGALTDVDLPFTVEKSQNPIAVIEEECVTKTGYALTVGDDVMAPYAVYDLTIENMDYKFLSIAAIEYSPGESCQVTDMSDQFSWGVFRFDL